MPTPIRKPYEYIQKLVDEEDTLPDGDIIIVVSSNRRNLTTYRLWPGSPVGKVISEEKDGSRFYLVVAFNKDELRNWVKRRLAELEDN